MNLLDQYRYATQRWRHANQERDQAAADRARALADMAAAGWDIERIARATHLSPSRVEQLVAKGRKPGPYRPTEGDTDA